MWKRDKVFEICFFFCNIEICERTYKGLKKYLKGDFKIYISNIHLCLMCVPIFDVFGWHVTEQLIFKYYKFAKL